MKVLLVAPLSTFNGYGNVGIGLTQALQRWGVEIELAPRPVQAPIPPSVAYLLTRRLEPPYDLTIVLNDPGSLELPTPIKKVSDLSVAWTMWEATSMENLRFTRRHTLGKRIDRFDALISYSEVDKSALAQHVSVPQGVVQSGYDPAEWPAVKRDWSGKFKFCMVGNLNTRKDPMVSVEAFYELKKEHPEFDAELHLKTQVTALPEQMTEWCPDLYIYREIWSQQRLMQFYSQMHVLLAPSRGEGLNLPCVEFLSTGGTVVATDWAGHVGWLSTEYAYPLNYDLRPDYNLPNCLSARADKNHLKSLMWHIFENRNEAKQKGETAARTMPLMMSWDSQLERFFRTVATVVPDGRGAAMLQKAVACRQEREERD